MTEPPDSLLSLMDSLSSHHNRLVPPQLFTAIACPLTVQPDRNTHRWAPGRKIFAKRVCSLDMRIRGTMNLQYYCQNFELPFPLNTFLDWMCLLSFCAEPCCESYTLPSRSTLLPEKLIKLKHWINCHCMDHWIPTGTVNHNGLIRNIIMM